MKEIHEVADLAEFAGKVIYYEMEWNQWKNFALLDRKAVYFDTDEFGYCTTEAILPSGTHMEASINDGDIARGSVRVRLATPGEMAWIELSYHTAMPAPATPATAPSGGDSGESESESEKE